MADDALAERTRLAAIHADLTARIDDMQSSREAVRARLLELGPGPAGALRVQVTTSRRLDAAAAAAAFPQAEYPDLYESKPRAAAFKGLDRPDLYLDGSPALRVVEAD